MLILVYKFKLPYVYKFPFDFLSKTLYLYLTHTSINSCQLILYTPTHIHKHFQHELKPNLAVFSI
jgi:hypothetical protein